MVFVVIIPNLSKIEQTVSLYNELKNSNCGLVPIVVTEQPLNIPNITNVPCGNYSQAGPQLLSKQISFVINLSGIDNIINNPSLTCCKFISYNNKKYTFIINDKSYSFSSFSYTDDSFFSFLQQIYSSTPSIGVKYNEELFVVVGGKPADNVPIIQQNPLKVNTNTNNKTLIKPLCNWTSPKDLHTMWKKMEFGLDKKFEVNPNTTTPDYYMVINQPTENVPPKKTLYFAMEPNMKTNSFSHVYDAFEKSYPLFFGSHDYHLNNVEWHLSLTREQLLDITFNKTHDRVLSAIVSNKDFDEGHKRRLKLLKELDTRSKNGELPFELHIYGSCDKFNFYNYKGPLPVNKKDDGLFPYKYHFCCENNSIHNYITEKFTDSLLGECLSFYWGAPNISHYYDTESFVQLQLDDIENDIQIITDTIMKDDWDNRIQSIKKEKVKALNKYNLFARVNTVLDIHLTNVFVNMVTKDDMESEPIKNIRDVLLKQSFHNINYAIMHQMFLPTQMQVWKACIERNMDSLFLFEKDTDKLKLLYNDLIFGINEAKHIDNMNPDIVIMKQYSGSYYMKVDVLKKLMNFVEKGADVFKIRTLEEIANQNGLNIKYI